MSEMNIKTNANNKSNELIAVNNCEGTISENLWIIGVSKTHPGLKYYFNTVTGVSLWNISKEDMERAKQTMKSQQNQSLYINCPEPKDPPPGTRLSAYKPGQTHCKHVPQHSKHCNKQHLNCELHRETPAFTCDVCYSSVNSPPNVITVNFRSCPHPTCSSQADNVYSTQSQTQSTPTLLGNSNAEKNHSKGLHDVFESKRRVSKSSTENVVWGSSNEHLSNNQSNTDNEFFNQNTSHFEMLDLTPLKIFARMDVIKDKWYIIADADVFLHEIKLLKSVVSSDNQCSLMVPRNVRMELESATKTEFRTKAHCANYFIYKMFDLQRALIDEDSSENIYNMSNEEHILECCMKLRDQNFYVVVISNDIDLQKYRNKIYIPIFTVSEIKEYLYKGNNCNTTKSPESTLNFSPSSKNMKVPTTKTNPDIIQSKNIRTSEVSDDIGNSSNAMSKTVDAEVQTSLHPIQLEQIERVYKNTGWPTQNEDISRRKELLSSSNQSLENSLNKTNSGPSKRIKLRRRKTFNQTETNSASNKVEMSAKPMEKSNNVRVSPCNDNLLHNKKLEERNKKMIDDSEKPNETITQHVIEKKTETSNLFSTQFLKLHQDKAIESIPCKDIVENKNVMFEVTTQMMDENLRTRCDEYVSRFVQIMEEALTQVLRKNSLLHLPPPWNMYEAATCVEKIFHDDEDIADASKKFLNILNRICDKKGNINSNITPTQYMEMYSYGVYMIDALQGIFSTCEDLQTGAEYLSKLLNDIQNPETDMPNLEPLNISQEENIDNTASDDKVEVLMIVETESVVNEEEMKIGENNDHDPNLTRELPSENERINERFKDLSKYKVTITNNIFDNQNLRENIERHDKSQEDSKRISSESKNTSKDAITSPSRYNLRSKTLTTSPEKIEREPSKEIIRNDNFKRMFLSNFQLQKNMSVENSLSRRDSFEKNITAQNVNDDVDSSGYLEAGAGNSFQLINYNTDLPHENTTPNEPKVIRNFVVCSELEDRLKTRRIHDEMDEFDFEEDFVVAGYLDDEVSSGGTGRLQIDEFREYPNNFDEYHQIVQKITKSTEYVKIEFKYFVKRIADEIKELSSEVYTFSRNSYEVLNSSSASEDKIHIRKRAEKTHLYIDKICTALTKILNRDKNDGYYIQELLRHTEFDDISVDEEQLEVYGSFIARCLEYACELKNTVENVLSAVC